MNDFSPIIDCSGIRIGVLEVRSDAKRRVILWKVPCRVIKLEVMLTPSNSIESTVQRNLMTLEHS